MIKIKMKQGATVAFPNLGTSVAMHYLGLRITDRCGTQRLRNTVLHNGVTLSVKDGVLRITEPYNCKVTVEVNGQMEIDTAHLTHSVSGAQFASSGGFYHPRRGGLKLQEGDSYDFSINGLGKLMLTATEGGVDVSALGYSTMLELE